MPLTKDQATEALKVVLTNVLTNQKSIENTLAQGEQQMSIANDNLANCKLLVATIQHALTTDSTGEIVRLAESNAIAAAAVASSPPQPAVAPAAEATAGAAS